MVAVNEIRFIIFHLESTGFFCFAELNGARLQTKLDFNADFQLRLKKVRVCCNEIYANIAITNHLQMSYSSLIFYIFFLSHICSVSFSGKIQGDGRKFLDRFKSYLGS